jgi:curved DNA-binding protein CbpA
MSQSGNLYDILGLKRYASIDEVKTKFRQLAVRYHPDKNPGNKEVEELFKKMVAAYNVLSDEEEKRNYDLRLSGFYTYHKVETEEQKKAKRREQVKRMRKRMKEQEEREIQQVYEDAKRKISYPWRYIIVAVTTILCLLIILNNWFLFDAIGERETSFFKMFGAYGLSTFTTVFFLNSLFKKWNARAIKKPFGFDVRHRIATFFLIYIFLMLTFSFNVPKYYKQFQLNTFGKTTSGSIYYNVQTGSFFLSYEVDEKEIIKDLGSSPLYISTNSDFEVEIQYSSVNPYIVKVKRFSSFLEL